MLDTITRTTPVALLRRRSTHWFETPAPAVFATLLLAQDWDETPGRQGRLRMFWKDCESIGVDPVAGDVFGMGDEALTFLTNLVSWFGGEHE